MSSRNGCFQNEMPYCFILRPSVTALILRASHRLRNPDPARVTVVEGDQRIH